MLLRTNYIQSELTGHIIPDTNAAYDLGSAERKIRHLFLSDNSLHILGGTTISAGDTLGDIQFPSGITVTKDSSINGNLTVIGASHFMGGSSNSDASIAIGGETNNGEAFIQKWDATNKSLNFYPWGGKEADGLVLQSDGNIGIGATIPDRLLDVENSDGHAFVSIVGKNDSRAAILLGDTDSDSQGRIDYDNSDDHLHFSTSETEAMRIDSAGNVGIGTSTPGAKLDIDGGIHLSGLAITPDEEGRVNFSEEGIMVGQAAVKPDPDNPESLYFQAIPQVKDTEGNAVTVLTADKLGLGTSAVLESSDQDLQFKLLTDQNRFVVGTSGNAENTIASGWYRFNDFKVKGATGVGAHPINPVDTRIYSDESSFILFKEDDQGNRVAHLVGGDEEVSPNNAIALGIAVKVDNTESPEDIEFVHTDGESYSVVNGNSDSLGSNGLPIRQGFQAASLGSNPSPLLIDGGSF